MPCRTYLWPTSRSYTGQPTAELHTLGSAPLLAMSLDQICQSGARLAGPGEFTLRAFLSGQIDLPKAEAVLAVIDAHDDHCLRAALGQLAGGLSEPLNRLRDELLDLLADLEAGLDFVEEDIEFISADDLQRRIQSVHEETTGLIERIGGRDLDQPTYRVALIGSPNVGKSSLMNAMADRSIAIVSDRAGTTRDYVNVPIDLNGICCSLIDTAGVENAGIDTTAELSGPDQLAQQIALDQAGRADLRLVCVDASRRLSEMDRRMLFDLPKREPTLLVLTKTDLPTRIQPDDEPLIRQAIRTSSRRKNGLDELRNRIRDHLAGETGSDLMVASTATRCRDSLRLTADSLERSIALVTGESGEELVASELRVALAELGKVVGATYTDDILDRVFSRFCIGK